MDITTILNKIKESVNGMPLAEQVKAKTNDPFKILVSTMLSARTKDKVTIQACNRLFKKVKKPRDLEEISIGELEGLIKPVNYYKTKARNLKKLALLNKVPEEINELVKLPGVGRKTANLVRSVAFCKDAICVDTHVHRIMNRLGYVKTKSPYETEMELRQKLPRKHWREVNYLLVLFGKKTCKPISPWCSKCLISDYCPRIGVTRTR